MFDIITVGSATVDVFAHTESELIKIKSIEGEEELIAYPSGSKILIKNIDFQTGGGGTNTAVGFARLGLKTAFIGRLGRDSNAKLVLSELKKEKVTFLGQQGNGFTGYSIVLDSIEEDRTILAFKGENNNLGFPKKERLLTRWFYFSSMVDKSFKTQESISMFAKKRGIKIAFNPSSYLTKMGLSYIKKILENCTVVVMNKEEAEMLFGKKSIDNMLMLLIKKGPVISVITDGKNGVYACDGKRFYFQQANKVKVAETTGAGDAFASGFVSGMILKNDIKFAMNLGMANATSVVMHIGAKNKLLKLSEAMRAIKKNKKIRVKRCSPA
ncbi:MAG: carbohydrate kinase family protein [Candidatus Woesearchaeota archaeon]